MLKSDITNVPGIYCHTTDSLTIKFKEPPKQCSKIDVEKQAASEAAAKIKDKKVTIKAKAGSNDRLFGSVTSAQVADAINEQFGIKVDKKKINLSSEIKNFGSFKATVKFYAGISQDIDIEVEKA